MVDRTWLITGGCGFIGTSLIRELHAAGSAPPRVRVLDNLTVGSREDLRSVAEFAELSLADLGQAEPAPVELVVGDIRDADTAAAACAGADVVVHLAANTGVGPSVDDPRLDMECNVIGIVNMLEGARAHDVGRFVFASSGAPVGEVDPPIHEELAPHPVSPYGASKLAGEGYCSAYSRTFGVETVALRFGNVYGPGSGHKASVVAKFIKLARAGERLEIYGDGGQTRDFIYIGDLVRAIVLGATVEGVGGETFQIATASETTVSELTDELIRALAEHGTTGVEVFHSESRLGDVRRNFSDTSKADRMLGWRAEVALPDGLRKTVAWFVGK